MIPKPLNEIEWSDIEALRDSGREEDDTIEFKGSFSGGADFLAFNDKQRNDAVDGIAKEVIAFLNGRGGDVVIGAKEFKNEHPKIESLTPVQNVVQTVDRLAQALAAAIEPVQSVLALRAIPSPAGDGTGVIVLRAQSSVRAPHRSRRSKECYVRRGRESVPMPMDEVQDIVLNRAMRRNELNEILNKQFFDIKHSRIGLRSLNVDRSHIRMCYIPDNIEQNDLDSDTLRDFFGHTPQVSNGKNSIRNEIAFEGLSRLWRPQLRGKFVESFGEYGRDFIYSKKAINRNMLMMSEFAIRHEYEQQGVARKVVHYDWIVGFFANSLLSIREVLSLRSQMPQGTLRVVAFFADGHSLGLGERNWGSELLFVPGVTQLPDFPVEGPSSLNPIFAQVQIDICSLAGVECPNPYMLPVE